MRLPVQLTLGEDDIDVLGRDGALATKWFRHLKLRQHSVSR
jgi:hypothetical protein